MASNQIILITGANTGLGKPGEDNETALFRTLTTDRSHGGKSYNYLTDGDQLGECIENAFVGRVFFRTSFGFLLNIDVHCAMEGEVLSAAKEEDFGYFDLAGIEKKIIEIRDTDSQTKVASDESGKGWHKDPTVSRQRRANIAVCPVYIQVFVHLKGT